MGGGARPLSLTPDHTRAHASAPVNPQLRADLAQARADLDQARADLSSATLALQAAVAAVERVARRLEGGEDAESGAVGAGALHHPDALPHPPSPDELAAAIDFLAQRGIQVKSLPPPDDAEEHLAPIATFMGERYASIKTFYQRLKATLGSGRALTLNLADEPQEVMGATCQLATDLHALAFLAEYKYKRSPQYLLHARINRLPRALNFLSGGWLERYAASLAARLAARLNGARGEAGLPQVRVSLLKNPQISLPNGDDFELDLLIEAQGQALWLELKTGEYQRYVAKYARMSALLALPPSRALMVLTDINPHASASLSGIFQMRVLSVEELPYVLEEAMCALIPPP